MGSFVAAAAAAARSDSDNEENAENDMVALSDHRDAPAGPSNYRTLSDTTRSLANKSGPDKATEGTTALGSGIGGSVDSGGGAARALPGHGLGPEQGPRPRTSRWSL